MTTMALETLDVWRDIERLLETLPPEDARIPELRAAAEDLRQAHQRLVRTSEITARLIQESRGTIDQPRALVQQTRRSSRRGGPA
jgi:hypothetical protein